MREHGYVHERYPATARPAESLSSQLTFALKHEGVHLEFLARLFTHVPSDELEAWIAAEPTGQYARRAGFFYEFLTGRRLDFPGVLAGNYVAALDETLYLTSRRATNNRRWRVRDNLPGTRDFCPVVLRAAEVRQAEQYRCAEHLAALEAEFGVDILQRRACRPPVGDGTGSLAG